MEIPRNWFLNESGQPEKWSGKIELTATVDFKYIGVLNLSKRLYLGFNGINLEKFKSIDEMEKIALRNYETVNNLTAT